MCLRIIIIFIIICSAIDVQCLDTSSILGRIFNASLVRFDPKLIPQTKCIEEVGCFSNGPPWYDPLLRPFSAVPEDLDDIEYYLFTPKNRKNPYLLKNTQYSVEASPFDSRLPTKILIHGFHATEESLQEEIRQKDALLNYGDYNVIVVDYSGHTFSFFYLVAANIRVVSARTVLLLNTIMKLTGAQAKDMHCIGPSLGAHACGYIGKKIPNLGRISGLSPAGPYFDGTPPEVHLTPSDALFVDVINTAAGGLGSAKHVGHQNFYPEGAVRLPGCKDPASSYSILKRIEENSCAHVQAMYHYTDSIKFTNCSFKAVKCSSYEDFIDKKCLPENSQVIVMGFHAKPIPGIEPEDSFYLRTGDSEPYCVQNSELPPENMNGTALARQERGYQNLLLREFIILFSLI